MEFAKMICYKGKKNELFDKVSISDCQVKSIEIDGSDLVLHFDSAGFWICERLGEMFHRVDEAELSFLDCDIENVDIRFIERKKILWNFLFLEKHMSLEELVTKIENGSIEFEIIQEYESAVGGLLFGLLRQGKKRMNCYLELQYKDKEYRYF